MLYEGALGNTAKQIEQVVGISGHKQNIRERYSQKLQSLQVNCWFNMIIYSNNPTFLFWNEMVLICNVF